MENWREFSDDGHFMDLVGPFLVNEEESIRRIGIVVQPKHANWRGVVHGGMIATLLDRALGFTVGPHNDSGGQATIEPASTTPSRCGSATSSKPAAASTASREISSSSAERPSWARGRWKQRRASGGRFAPVRAV